MFHTLSKISKNLDQNTPRLARDSEKKAKIYQAGEPQTPFDFECN
jgi:hypothetical protein